MNIWSSFKSTKERSGWIHTKVITMAISEEEREKQPGTLIKGDLTLTVLS